MPKGDLNHEETLQTHAGKKATPILTHSVFHEHRVQVQHAVTYKSPFGPKKVLIYAKGPFIEYQILFLTDLTGSISRT